MSEDDKDLEPKVVIPPEIQKQMDANPELAKAMKDMMAEMKNAMQAVKDGRYATFEDAIEAIIGQRPQQIIPRYEPKYGYYLTTAPAKNHPGKLVAILSDGSPQKGHADACILIADVVDDEEAAKRWGERMKIEEPWMDEGPEEEDDAEDEDEDEEGEFEGEDEDSSH